MQKSKLESVQSKIVDSETLARICAGWKVNDHKIIFTNGCFDILHQGHIKLLLSAAELGNKLILGLNTDASVKKLKGENRPVNDEYSRALVMASQLFVDAVCLFEEDTPLELIQIIKPDVIVKGGDYTPETVVGNDFVQSYGGKTVIIPTVEGFSTTNIISKMK
ncbi:D-glycero-beta-D-manno-heptose 1-phosphate adenylyltransferase [Taibaiella lutea]|uniref:D-glycero-beta-D-manno-heptose 1-phosphate adenylyltransferase n=1 Tax=Taibaiella lutea TaxID=2608001 RepID=A0A5M6CT04_9BACT|nr:D-glycero-beta-D-manno-heptose 1-phosphate adenylyltransferase [Taibaiella lutea]KAA5537092.1 D-glycero-beta-D-manno-heptose 1-phosphate adenylyltransferase [Taibaiella lutea]